MDLIFLSHCNFESFYLTWGWSLAWWHDNFISGWGKQSSGGGASTASVFQRVARQTLAYTRCDPKR